ncbi:MAG: MgtC/SapB family protein [Gemmatimonadales bacterium]
MPMPGDDIALRLGAAALVGSLLGLNRELKHKPAGLRTLALVGLGASVAAIASVELGGGGPDSVSRIAQGVMTGIGFLGAGVILRRDSDQGITGLTTAASIWVTAVLGLACGLGQWRLASVGVAFALGILVVGAAVEGFLHRWVHRHSSASVP